jgi:hypothetical protein
MTIEDRVSKLEREGRTWRRIAIGLAAVLGVSITCSERAGERNPNSGQSGAAIAVEPERIYEKIRLKNLEIVDDAGNTVGGFRADTRQGGSAGALWLTCAPPSGDLVTLVPRLGLVVFSRNGSGSLGPDRALWSRYHPEYVRLMDQARSQTGQAATNAFKLAEGFLDQGKSLVSIGGLDADRGAVGAVTVYNVFGKVAATMHADNTNQGAVYVSDVNGQVRNSLTVP